MPHYSIAIRTLGRAGEKYKKLLNSISNSALQPDKVVVVLPKGYVEPQDRLGTELFVYCPKSMIGQRIEALKYIDSEYTLFLDDDIEFDPGFVEKLLRPLEEGEYDCSSGPLFSFFPQSTAGKIAGTLTGSVCTSLFKRNMYVKILRSGGWSYHTFDTSVHKYYPTESFAWTCFAIKTAVMKELNMEEEKAWLERFGYACGDDRVMAYKLICMGYRSCIVSNAEYIHNDAKTSTSKEEMDRYLPKFCMYYMHTVFWHRFIQIPGKSLGDKFLNRICFTYWNVSMRMYLGLKSVLKKDSVERKAFSAGVAEGKHFIETAEYEQLSQIGQ